LLSMTIDPQPRLRSTLAAITMKSVEVNALKNNFS